MSPLPKTTFLSHPLIILAGFLVVLGSGSPSDIPGVEYNASALHFVPGTVIESLDEGEEPLYYDSYLPLFFQFQVPKHMDNALKIMWTHATVCNTSDSRYEGKLCPVVHHLHKIIANLSSDMGVWKDFIPPLDDDVKETLSLDWHNLHPVTSSTSDPLKTTPTSSSRLPPHRPNCGEIRPHFRQPYTPPNHLSDYLASLSACPLGSSTTTPNLLPPPIPWIIDKQIYYTMVDRFYSEFYRALPGTGNIDWVVTLNSYVNAQDLLLANNYMESARVLAALLQCRDSSRIPISFIKPEMLRDALKSNRNRVTSAHLAYLWDDSNDDLLGSIQSYYGLPIADCTLTKDYKLLVRILIPLRVPEVETRLLQVKTFPFLEKLPVKKGTTLNKTKPSGPHPPVENSSSSSLQLCKLQAPGTLRMIQSSFGLLFEPVSGCEGGGLCSRASLNSFLPLDACSAAILSPSGDESLIRRGCDLSCFPIDPRSLPIFQRTSSDTFLALGTREHQIFLQCGGQPLEKLGLVELGALEIRLTCGCQISYRSLVLRPSTPCEGSTGSGHPGPLIRVKRLLPLHWEELLIGNGTPHGIEDGEDEFGMLSKILAEKKDKYFHYDHQHLKEGSSVGVGVVMGDNENTKKSAPQVSIHSLNPSCDDGDGCGLSSGLVAQLVFLWILVLGLGGVVATLGVKVHQLLHWRKIQVYKDTRIVYSVPPSPQFPNKF